MLLCMSAPRVVFGCGHLVCFLWHFCFWPVPFRFVILLLHFTVSSRDGPCAPLRLWPPRTAPSAFFCPLHAHKAEMVRPPARHHHKARRSLLGCGERAKAPRGLQMRRLVAYLSAQ